MLRYRVARVNRMRKIICWSTKLVLKLKQASKHFLKWYKIISLKVEMVFKFLIVKVFTYFLRMKSTKTLFMDSTSAIISWIKKTKNLKQAKLEQAHKTKHEKKSTRQHLIKARVNLQFKLTNLKNKIKSMSASVKFERTRDTH